MSIIKDVNMETLLGNRVTLEERIEAVKTNNPSTYDRLNKTTVKSLESRLRTCNEDIETYLNES